MFGEWVNARERLPEESGIYIVYMQEPTAYRCFDPEIDTSYTSSANYDKETGLWRECEDSYYCANLSCVDTEHAYYISHWMPMPEKPNKEE